jgi:alpha-glucosidase (family GH31 glycosyl hydrolase)
MQESGVMEFYLIGSKDPKGVQKKLSDVTGYPMLPPMWAIGFHYSKWEDKTSAASLFAYNSLFTDNEFPLDVLWMDIPGTDGNRYFTFN